MAIDFNLGTTVHFIMILSSFFLAFFMLLISLFNQNVKGFIYLGGVLLGSFIWKLFNGFFTNHLDSHISKSPICSLTPFISGYVSYNSYFICFTMIYVFLPIFITNQTNWGLVIFFLSLFVSDAYYSVISGCYKDGWGPALGAIIGILCGIMWFELFYQSELSELLYFNDLNSNKESCSRPQKQNFKCSVFKDGKLVGTM